MCREYRFVNQIRDAARGGTRNIAEGYGRFIPREILYYLRIAKASLDETKDELIDGLESGYWSRTEFDIVHSYLRRTQGAIRGWRRYLESPEAARFYEQHKARIELQIKLGHRRPPKDPALRPWRRKKNPQNPDPAEPSEPVNP